MDPTMFGFSEREDIDPMMSSFDSVMTVTPQTVNQMQPIIFNQISWPNPSTESPDSSQPPQTQSTGSTGDTSFTDDLLSFSGSSWHREEPMLPDHDPAALNFIEQRHDLAQPIPQHLEDDLAAGHEPDSAQPSPSSQPFTDQDRAATVRPMMGISNHTDMPARPLPQQRAEALGHLKQINDGCRFAILNTRCGADERDQLRQARQSLTYFSELIDGLIDGSEAPRTGPPSIKSAKSAKSAGNGHGNAKVLYRCMETGCHAKFYNRGSFKRHIVDQHHPNSEFHCPKEDCDTVHRRKDKIDYHYRAQHKQEPNKKEIERNNHPLPCPPHCAICYCLVHTWAGFYNCFMKHCLVNPTESNPSSSRRSSLDQNMAAHEETPNGRDDYPPAAAPTQDSGLAPSRRKRARGSSPGFSGPGGYPRQPTVRPNPARSVSDNIIDRHPQQQANQPAVAPTHGPPNAGHHQSIQRPPTTVPFRTQPQPRQNPPNDAAMGPKCNICSHRFADCRSQECRRTTESVNGCHICYRDSAAILMNQMGSGPSYMTGFPLSQDIFIDPRDLNNAGLQLDTNFAVAAMNPAYQTQMPRMYGQNLSPDDIIHRMQHYPGSNSSSPRSSFTAMAVTHIEDSPISEVEMERSSGLGFKLARPIEALFSRMSLGVPWKPRPFRGLNTLSYPEILTKKVLRPPMLDKTAPFECQCPCRNPSQDTHSARVRADLAPGRQVDIRLKLSPHERGHPFRTRVQVVVKMLRLRSSVAKSADAKAKWKAKLAIEEAFESTLSRSSGQQPDVIDPEEHDDSDTVSVCDSDTMSVACSTWSNESTSTACTELTSDSPARPGSPVESEVSLFNAHSDCFHDEEKELEKEVELAFNFDLQPSLYKLAQWTGWYSDDLSSDLTKCDPDRVFEYFFQYILFLIMSLARSHDYNFRPCFEK
ncbi:hypothetical protein N7462_001771 [Penicillium macrosclerotiorum]|uniref:uncharacterized protein n=1 Tax=Penicillium macrosclerotiorum TaxID=303699 RepID=UPI002548F5CC|nr:uncharacterized protein N7462_001771 [Penicillium macrosclerotiorum]KAJ5692348.1 hypothetical protein N7462_001771 [Penicillium macrosclerotiorum]